MIRPALILLLSGLACFGSDWFVSPSVSSGGSGTLVSPGALTNALTHVGWASSIAGDDTVWLRGGTYSNALWTVSFSGTSGHLVNWRSYGNEWAKIDRQWRFGASLYHRFRNLEFYDSYKGINPTNVDFSLDGPWLHFDGSLAFSSGNEWINCVLHDVDNCWSGGTSGDSVRGCIIWHVGLNGKEHVSYPAPDAFIGNISGWHTCDGINLNSRAFLGQSNIMFGAGQSANGQVSGDFRLSTNPSEVSYNYIYNRYASDKLYNSIVMNDGSGIVNSNMIVSGQGASFIGMTNVTMKGNLIHMASPFAAYPVFHRYSITGTWAIDFNRYSAQSPQDVVLEDPSTRYTFSGWRTAFPAFDASSVSANSSLPSDAVYVIPNQDEAKRAHIAVYNFSSSDVVAVSLTGVLNAGDYYQLYSAQNYAAGAIRTGTYNGTSIIVPMTNLTTAPILYGTNWGLIQPPPTSPEFAAFVVTGQASAVMAGTLILR